MNKACITVFVLLSQPVVPLTCFSHDIIHCLTTEVRLGQGILFCVEGLQARYLHMDISIWKHHSFLWLWEGLQMELGLLTPAQ